MSLSWNLSNSNHSAPTPGAINNFDPNYNQNQNSLYNGTDALLQQFNAGLADHKKKSMALIQNFLAANTKFDEFTEHFMTKINPIIKDTADRHKEESNGLREEVHRLRAKISSLENEIEGLHQEKSEMARRIMKFCESAISPTQFELFVGALFCALGYSIEHNGKTHDGGIDLIVRHYERGKGVVQVKQYRNSKVTEPQIRDLYGALCAKQEVEYGIMVVLSDCTKEAKTWPDREGVKNLIIWTHKELVSMLQQKGNETLIEFIRILIQKQDRDLQQAQSGMFVTPKHQRQKQANPFYKNKQIMTTHTHSHSHSQSIPSSIGRDAHCTKSRRREPPSSTLSSAKKRGVKAKQDRNANASTQLIASMAKQWAQCKFTVNEETECGVNGSDRASGPSLDVEGADGNGNGIGDRDRERLNDEEESHSPLQLKDNGDIENRRDSMNSIHSKQSQSGRDGETSPHSTRSESPDSSLLIDESQSDEENQAGFATDDHPAKTSSSWNSSFSNGIISSGLQCDGKEINTNLMWSISNVNKQRERRKRRPWLAADDNLIMAGIAQFATNWMESTEQWDAIYRRNKHLFSQKWTLKDVRKHYHRALKPKLVQQHHSKQASSYHSSHSTHY